MEIYIEDPDLGTLVHMYQGLADQNELVWLPPAKLLRKREKKFDQEPREGVLIFSEMEEIRP